MSYPRQTWQTVCLLALLGGGAFGQSIDDTIELNLEALLQSTSPVADGTINPGEYASSMFLSFVDLENPGSVFPGLNQMCGAEDIICNDEDEVEGDGDLSATVHWGYTADNFFIAFDVSDQFIDADEGADPWNNDGVELFIDADGDGEDERQFGLEAMQIVSDTIEGRGSGSSPFWIDADPQPGEWTSATELTDTGYHMEFQIPLGSLDMESSDPPTIDAEDAVPVMAGHTMRMNFAINDIDIEGGGQGDGTHAMWWLYEDNPASPFGGAEGNWVVGMTLGGPAGPVGDFNGNGEIDSGDLDVLAQLIKDGDAAGDVNGDGSVNIADRLAWVETIQGSWIGDSNFDGEFNSGDFVAVFTTGKYESGDMATYAEGDWNGDMVFDSGDFVTVFGAGGYEAGPRAAAAAVPEPATLALLSIGLLGLLRIRWLA